MPSFCAVYGCPNISKYNKDQIHFALPRDKDRRKVWIELIGRQDLFERDDNITQFVCAEHFSDDMFVNNRIKLDAVPNLNLPHTVIQLTSIDKKYLEVSSNQEIHTTMSFEHEEDVSIKVEEVSVDNYVISVNEDQLQSQNKTIMGRTSIKTPVIVKVESIPEKSNLQPTSGEILAKKRKASNDNNVEVTQKETLTASTYLQELLGSYDDQSSINKTSQTNSNNTINVGLQLNESSPLSIASQTESLESTLKNEQDFSNIDILCKDSDSDSSQTQAHELSSDKPSSSKINIKKCNQRRRYCGVYGCLTSSLTNPDYAFFALPTDKQRRVRWLQLISRKDLVDTNKYCCIDESHFNPSDILTSINRKVLKKTALPALNLPVCVKVDKGVDACAIKNNVYVQTLKNLSDNVTQTTKALFIDSERIKNLQTQIKECKKQLRTLKGRSRGKTQKEIFFKLCDRFLSENLADLIKVQTKLKCHNKGNRYTPAYKMFCFNLYHVSPQAYKLMEKAFFLPCRRTLDGLYAPVSSEVSDELMSTLKVKVISMSENEKYCSVVAGTMSLKCNLFYDIRHDKIVGFHEIDGIQSPTPAQTAFVIIIQGILVNWMQPIGFALLSDGKDNDEDIVKWIDKILTKLLEIGLKVKAFVSDFLSVVLRSILEKKIVTVERPFFFINDAKIYYIFDSSHLLTSLRDDFMTNHLCLHDGTVAKFEHIKQFYELDKTKKFRLAEKLTDVHMNPKRTEKLNISIASELFCKSVAAGISSYIDINIIDGSARDTVKFLLNINELVNILNSSIPCEDETQVNFLYNMLHYLHSLKLINPKNGADLTQNAKFIHGYQITISSILFLIEDLKHEGQKCLVPTRLNQDIVTLFFEKIKSKDWIGDKPPSRQFVPSFRKLYFSNMFKPTKGIRKDDISQFIIKLNEFNNAHVDGTVVVPQHFSELQNISPAKYKYFELPEENVIFHLSEFLFNKCVEQHKDCNELKSYVESSVKKENFHLFTSHVERMENEFRNAFNVEHLNSKIGNYIYSQIKKIPFSLPCPCYPINYQLKLFVRLRIFITIKLNNKEYQFKRVKKDKVFTVNNF